MSGLTPDDVRRWDAEAVLKVFQVANARGQTLHQFGRNRVRRVSCSPSGTVRPARRSTAVWAGCAPTSKETATSRRKWAPR